jgi:hyperosmotically inducible protein
MKPRILILVCSLFVGSGLAQAQSRPEPTTRAVDRIQKKIRRELVTLPFLGVFDNLAYQVNGYDVTLLGQVTRPALKSDAENVVKGIEGVEHINNKIEVLPPSPFDDDLRLRLFRAIYGGAPLDRYSLGVNKPIRIVVNQGHVILEGVVDSETDKNLASLRANGVSDVFSITNNLQVAK